MTIPFTIDSSKTCGIYQLTASDAEYILANHNGDNRKLSTSHVSKIKKNVSCEGWVFDGQPITFNTSGNLTEGQHRLTVISQCRDADKLFETVVVTGVDPDTFSTTQGAKPRRAVDEIQRKHRAATNESISVLADLCQRKRGAALDINNAVDNWNEWRLFIQEGTLVADSLLSCTSKFDSQQKTVRAVATFCCRYGMKEQAEILFGMLEDEIGEAAEQVFARFYHARSDFSVPQQTFDVLEALCQRYPLVAVTNGNVDIDRVGLSPYFVGYYRSGENQTRMKPHPDMLHLVCQHLDLNAESVLHIGDNEFTDVGSAHRAGCASLWFNPNGRRLKTPCLPDGEYSDLDDLLQLL